MKQDTIFTLMKTTPNPLSEETQALRDARRKYAAASVVRRYEALRKATGMNGAERLQAQAEQAIPAK